jgi:hypothetical protein
MTPSTSADPLAPARPPRPASRLERGAAETGARGARDLRLDFFRGLALFFIFIDHIPANTLSYFTLTAIGFSDAAEVFIFISGYTAAMVYGGTMLRQGSLFATAQIYRRVWQLYVAHIFLFVIFTAEVSYTVQTFSNPMYNEELRVGDFLAEPHIAIVKALLLQFQPTFLDILPLYIVLLAGFPLILQLLKRHSLAALAPALALYGAAQLLGLALPGFPEGHLWYFNPFAWQLLFTIGAVFGFARVAGRDIVPSATWLIGAAAAIVAVSFVIDVSWTIHGLYDPFPALLQKQLWPINKSNLVPIRLVHFLAVAMLVVVLVPEDSRFLGSRFARPIIRCGQQSLQIFCLSILLSVLGHFVLTEWSSGLPAQLLVNLVGMLVMIGTAALLHWYRQLDRAVVTGPGGRGGAPPSAAQS